MGLILPAGMDSPGMVQRMQERFAALGMWGYVVAYWVTGKRWPARSPIQPDPARDGIRYLTEQVLGLRAELNAMAVTLTALGVIDKAAWPAACEAAAADLNEKMRETFDGMQATHEGIAVNAGRAKKMWENRGRHFEP